MLLLRDKDQQ